MKQHPKGFRLVAKALLCFVVYPLGFGAGLGILLRVVTSYLHPPYAMPAGMLVFAVYLYCFARWVLHVPTRPLRLWK